MSTEGFAPPINLIDDFQALQASIAGDQGGNSTRQLVGYFREAEGKALEMRLRTQDYEQKEFAALLSEACAASTHIVLAAWEKAHGSELVV